MRTMDEERGASQEKCIVVYTNNGMSSRTREECRSSPMESLCMNSQDIGRNFSLPMKAPSNNGLGRKTDRKHQHQDSANIDIDVRRSRRCEISLALSIASLITISCISSSSTRSEAATAAITISSLSFVITSILTVVGYSSNTRLRDIFITSPIITRTQYGRSLRSKVTFEELGTSIVLVLQCIISGLVLYPRFDTDVIAVAGNDVWNSNLFYSTWFSLYASAHMFSKVLCRNGSHFINAQYHSSMLSPLFMCLFSFTCTATALLIIRSGPACRDELLSETPYCISALAGGSVSAVCVVVMLLVGAVFCLPMVFRCISPIRINLLMIIGAATVLIVQCVILGKVTSPSGAGYTIGNAFVTSWMSFITSLFLLKNVVDSWFLLPAQGIVSAIKDCKQECEEMKSTTTTDDGDSCEEDRGSCFIQIDLPTEVITPCKDNNLRTHQPQAEPEESYQPQSLPLPGKNDRAQQKADAVQSKVMTFRSRSSTEKVCNSHQARRIVSPNRTQSHRIDPQGLKYDKSRPKSMAKHRVNSKEPPSSQAKEKSPLGTSTSSDRDFNSKSVDVGQTRDIPGIFRSLYFTEFCPSSTNQQQSQSIDVTSNFKSEIPIASTTTPPPRRASFVSNMSPVREMSKEDDTRRSSSSLSSESKPDKNSDGKSQVVDVGKTASFVGSKTVTSKNGSLSIQQSLPPPSPPPPPPPPRSRNDTSKDSSKKSIENRSLKDKETSSERQRSTKQSSNSEKLFVSIPSETPNKSSVSEIGSVPLDVLLSDDQTVITELTPVTYSRYSTPTGVGDRKLSVAVAAALHAAAVSANTEKKANIICKDEAVRYLRNAYKPKRSSSRQERSLSPSTMRKADILGTSLQSGSLFNGSVSVPLVGTFQQKESSKNNIQGGNVFVDNARGVGILKNSHDLKSGEPSDTSSHSLLERSRASGGQSQSQSQRNESDLVFRALSARMKGGRRASECESGVTHQDNTSVHNPSHNHHPSITAHNNRRPLSFSTRRETIRSNFSEVDDSYTVHGEFEC